MAGGITLNPGSGGSVLATDLAGGTNYQVIKIGVGVDGSPPVSVSSQSPLPVQGTVTVAGIQTPIQVTGQVSLSQAVVVSSGLINAKVGDGSGNGLTSYALGQQRALSVAIVDAAGNQVTTFGGTGGQSQTDATAFTRGTSKENPIGALVETNAPTLTTGTLGALSMDTSGNLRVTITGGGVSSGTAGTPSADVLSVQGITGGVPLPVTIQPNDNPQTSTARINSAATTNATNLKTTSGIILAYAFYNNNTSSARYVKIYNKGSAPTPGTDTPFFVVPLQPGAGANISLGATGGMQLGTGIAYAITGGVADSDTTAVGANDVQGFIQFD